MAWTVSKMIAAPSMPAAPACSSSCQTSSSGPVSASVSHRRPSNRGCSILPGFRYSGSAAPTLDLSVSSSRRFPVKIVCGDTSSTEYSSASTSTTSLSPSEDLLNSSAGQTITDEKMDKLEIDEMEEEVKPSGNVIPRPGDGQKIYELDTYLKNHRDHLEYRYNEYKKKREHIDNYEGGLEAFSRGYEKMGFTRSPGGITYREWAPGAKWASLMGDFNNWNPNADVMKKNEFGVWEIFLPDNSDGSPAIPHGSRVKIHMDTPSGWKDAIPAWIKFAVQAPGEIPYNGIYYDPPPSEKYSFQHPSPPRPKSLRIYEAHVGMSSTVCLSTFL